MKRSVVLFVMVSFLRRQAAALLIGLFDDNGITEIEEDESDETESEETA